MLLLLNMWLFECYYSNVFIQLLLFDCYYYSEDVVIRDVVVVQSVVDVKDVCQSVLTFFKFRN